jgi:hypothetical protein
MILKYIPLLLTISCSGSEDAPGTPHPLAEPPLADLSTYWGPLAGFDGPPGTCQLIDPLPPTQKFFLPPSKPFWLVSACFHADDSVQLYLYAGWAGVQKSEGVVCANVLEGKRGPGTKTPITWDSQEVYHNICNDFWGPGSWDAGSIDPFDLVFFDGEGLFVAQDGDSWAGVTPLNIREFADGSNYIYHFEGEI